MYNRRAFLKLSGAATLGGLALGGRFNIFGQKKETFPISQAIYSDKSFAFNQQTFEPLVDTNFAFRVDDYSVISMRLIEVATKEATKNFSSQTATESFMLIFEIQNKAVLEDKIYQVTHPVLGDFSMFISTVGKSGKRYQAVFSRVYF